MTVENMKEEDMSGGLSSKEVIIYELGEAVLKVESGTTLKVLKLLYGASQEQKTSEILGVRPRHESGGIPCIITLDESKLNGISYDILMSENLENASTRPNSSNGENGPVTTRSCKDCFRESRDVGMNTEVSLNPKIEVNLSKLKPVISTIQPQLPTSPITTTTTSKPPSPIEKSITEQKTAENVQHKITENNMGINSNIVRNRHQEDLPALSPSQVYRPSHFKFPPLEAAMHYERFRQDQTPLIVERPWHESGNLSPHIRRDLSPTFMRRRDSPIMHHQRSRSPLSPRMAAEFGRQSLDMRGIGRISDIRMVDYPPSHYNAYPDKYRPVMLPTYPPGRSRRGEERTYYSIPDQERKRDIIYKDSAREIQPSYGRAQTRQAPPPPKLQDRTNPPAGEPGDEPPVFVLPNDYDAVNGIDPSVVSTNSPIQMTIQQKDQDQDLAVAEITNKELNQETKNENFNDDRQSPKENSVTANTGGDESPDSSNGSGNNSQKLYCKICSAVFSTKSLLYKHLRGHSSDEKPFKCNECGQGFTLSSNLRQHRIIHRGYKPFQCEFCGKKFMRSNVYKQHRRIHTGEEMHKCSLCPSEFLQKYALMKHLKKNHDIDVVEK